MRVGGQTLARDSHQLSTSFNRTLNLKSCTFSLLYLGTRIFTIICKMLATLLVLGYLRHHKPSTFRVQLTPPFKMRDSSEGSEIKWRAKFAKALTWLRTADKLVPCVCTRLQLGNNWEEIIPKLLGLDSLVWV